MNMCNKYLDPLRLCGLTVSLCTISSRRCRPINEYIFNLIVIYTIGCQRTNYHIFAYASVYYVKKVFLKSHLTFGKEDCTSNFIRDNRYKKQVFFNSNQNFTKNGFHFHDKICKYLFLDI